MSCHCLVGLSCLSQAGAGSWWEHWSTIIQHCLIILSSSLGLLEGNNQCHRPEVSLLSCVGLRMLGPSSPRGIRLGKVFMVLEPLDGHISASDWVVQGLKQQPPSVPTPHLFKLMSEALWFHVERWQSTVIKRHRFWNQNAWFQIPAMPSIIPQSP